MATLRTSASTRGKNNQVTKELALHPAKLLSDKSFTRQTVLIADVTARVISTAM
jgi:hypothetical protein